MARGRTTQLLERILGMPESAPGMRENGACACRCRCREKRRIAIEGRGGQLDLVRARGGAIFGSPVQELELDRTQRLFVALVELALLAHQSLHALVAVEIDGLSGQLLPTCRSRSLAVNRRTAAAGVVPSSGPGVSSPHRG
jgi:hypothetical protein